VVIWVDFVCLWCLCDDFMCSAVKDFDNEVYWVSWNLENVDDVHVVLEVSYFFVFWFWFLEEKMDLGFVDGTCAAAATVSWIVPNLWQSIYRLSFEGFSDAGKRPKCP